jgi:tetratricopeptide (TPR) repeat protein
LDPAGIIAAGLLAAAVLAAVRFRHSQPLVAFGAVWFIAVLAPSSSVVPLRDAMAEPRAYLASAGLFLAAASALTGPLVSRRAARAVALAVVLVLGLQTYQRNRIWSDPLRLWEEAAHRSPDAWLAHLGFADLLREIGRCDRAVPEYEAALRLNPEEPDATAGLESCRRIRTVP